MVSRGGAGFTEKAAPISEKEIVRIAQVSCMGGQGR
jgi:hypothetical protein